MKIILESYIQYILLHHIELDLKIYLLGNSKCKTKSWVWLYIWDLIHTSVTATGRSARWLWYWGLLWKLEQWWALVSRRWGNHSTFERSGCARWALLTQSTHSIKLSSSSQSSPVSGFEPGNLGVRSRHSTNELLSNSEKYCSETVPVQTCWPNSIFYCRNLCDMRLVHSSLRR